MKQICHIRVLSNPIRLAIVLAMDSLKNVAQSLKAMDVNESPAKVSCEVLVEVVQGADGSHASTSKKRRKGRKASTPRKLCRMEATVVSSTSDGQEVKMDTTEPDVIVKAEAMVEVDVKAEPVNDDPAMPEEQQDLASASQANNVQAVESATKPDLTMSQKLRQIIKERNGQRSLLKKEKREADAKAAEIAYQAYWEKRQEERSMLLKRQIARRADAKATMRKIIQRRKCISTLVFCQRFMYLTMSVLLSQGINASKMLRWTGALWMRGTRRRT